MAGDDQHDQTESEDVAPQRHAERFPTSSGPALDDLERKLAETQTALGERTDQHLRLAAELDNVKRRRTAEAAERARYASEDAALLLLPVLDNLRRALDTAPADTDSGLLDGVRLVAREFEAAFERLGVTPIESVGQPFDPSLHQAVIGEESSEVSEDTVDVELQRGYRLHDRVLRPAMVKVAHPASSTPASAGGEEAR